MIDKRLECFLKRFRYVQEPKTGIINSTSTPKINLINFRTTFLAFYNKDHFVRLFVAGIRFLNKAFIGPFVI